MALENLVSLSASHSSSQRTLLEASVSVSLPKPLPSLGYWSGPQSPLPPSAILAWAGLGGD